MALPSTLTRYRSADLFIKQETTAGTPIMPAANTEAFLTTEVPQMFQAGNYADLNEIGGELLIARRLLNYVDYTDYDLTFYAKPNSVGNAPAEDTLLEGFFGTGTASSGVKYTYTFANQIRTYTVHSLMKGSNVYDPRYLYSGSGSVPTNLSLALAKDGAVTYTMGMRSSRIFIASTGEIATSGVATSGNVNTLTLSAPKLNANDTVNAADAVYDGLKVSVVHPTNGTQRFGGNVTAGTITGATLQVESGGTNDGADGDFVQPDFGFNASPSTLQPIDQQAVQVFFAAQDADDDNTDASDLFNSANAVNVTAFSIDIDRGITSPATNEMNGTAFPSASYVINQVAVSGSVTMLCRPSDHAKIEGYRRSPTNAMGLKIGNTAGKKIEIYMPAVHMDIPTMSESEGVAQLELSFTLVKGSKTSDANKFALRYL